MSATSIYRNALPTGSTLVEYQVEAVLGVGGFGITYLCRDTHLDKQVAIKEYFPTDLVVRALDGGVVALNPECEEHYRLGLQRFVHEARTLAKFSHPHIVRVNRFFETNATGYMVMDYEDGQSLHQSLRNGTSFDESRITMLLAPLLDGLKAVHNAGFLHRDIKPSNIFLRTNGTPVLLDFGSARQVTASATKALTSIVTPGFAPLEQYTADGKQGPWTDLYAMGGVLFRVISGENPPDAVSRLKADTVPGKLALLKGRVSMSSLRAIEWAMVLDESNRPQSVDEWRAMLEGKMVDSVITKRRSQELPTRVTASPATSLPPELIARRPPMRSRDIVNGHSVWRWMFMGMLVLGVTGLGVAWYRQGNHLPDPATVKQTTSIAVAPPSEVPHSATQLEPAVNESPSGEGKQRAVVPEVSPQRQEPERAVEPVPPAPQPVTESVPQPRSVTVEPPAPLPAPTVEPQRAPVPEMARSADPMARQKEFDLRAMDANGDGYLTRDEVANMPLVPQEFDRIDTNRDGRISLEEFIDFRPFPPPSGSLARTGAAGPPETESAPGSGGRQ